MGNAPAVKLRDYLLGGNALVLDLHLFKQKVHAAQQDGIWHCCLAAEKAINREGGDSQAYSGFGGAELGDYPPEYRQTDRDGVHAGSVIAHRMPLCAVPHLEYRGGECGRIS